MSCDVSEATEGVGGGGGSAHSATLPSQLVFQPFCRFTYITCTSPTSPGEPHIGQTSPPQNLILDTPLRTANLRHGTHDFTCLPKEDIFRIFTFWKNPSTLLGSELANLESSGEYVNHWTTGVDMIGRSRAPSAWSFVNVPYWPP